MSGEKPPEASGKDAGSVRCEPLLDGPSGTRKTALLEKFREHGNNASYHYADDSGREWAQARLHKEVCLELFDAFPEWEQEFREISREFLWSLQQERGAECAGERRGAFCERSERC